VSESQSRFVISWCLCVWWGWGWSECEPDAQRKGDTFLILEPESNRTRTCILSNVLQEELNMSSSLSCSCSTFTLVLDPWENVSELSLLVLNLVVSAQDHLRKLWASCEPVVSKLWASSLFFDFPSIFLPFPDILFLTWSPPSTEWNALQTMTCFYFLLFWSEN